MAGDESYPEVHMSMPHRSPAPGRPRLSADLFDSLRAQLREGLDLHRSRLAEGAVDDDHDLNLAMQRRSIRAQEEIEAALERMDEDLYGVCASCQGPISTERLKAIPHALTCARCARV
jgi:DnaK suppressor protein